jgi:hypothetical protein
MMALGLALGLPFGGASAVWDPTAISSLTAWLDYRKLASVGDSQPIRSWTDNMGLLTLTQSGTACPTYAVNDGDGKPAAQFDGVNDTITTTISNSALYGSTGDLEIWYRFKISSAQSVDWGLSLSSGTTNSIGVYGNASYVFGRAPTVSQNVYGAGAVVNSTWHVLRFQKSGSSRLIALDGTTIYSGTTSAGTYGTGADALTMMTINGVYTKGSLRHALFFNAPLDSTTAGKLLTFLQTT